MSKVYEITCSSNLRNMLSAKRCLDPTGGRRHKTSSVELNLEKLNSDMAAEHQARLLRAGFGENKIYDMFHRDVKFSNDGKTMSYGGKSGRLDGFLAEFVSKSFPSTEFEVKTYDEDGKLFHSVSLKDGEFGSVGNRRLPDVSVACDTDSEYSL